MVGAEFRIHLKWPVRHCSLAGPYDCRRKGKGPIISFDSECEPSRGSKELTTSQLIAAERRIRLHEGVNPAAREAMYLQEDCSRKALPRIYIADECELIPDRTQTTPKHDPARAGC